MIRAPRRRFLTLAAVAAAVPACLQPSSAPAPAEAPLDARFARWTRYEGEPGATHFSSLDQIDRSNVRQLQVAWTYATPGATSYNPIIVDSVMFVIAEGNSIEALHAGTGRRLWSHTSAVTGGLAPRGLMYWESDDRADRRVLFTKGNYDLLAIDARTGQPIPGFGSGGRVDLRQGLDVDPLLVTRATSPTPGVIYDDLVILGSATGEGYVAAPGHVRAFDVRTGRQAWIFHTLPRPGEYGYDTWPPGRSDRGGGANVWGGMSVDAERGIVYLPLGSANYDFYGIDRPGQNLFANSLVALDARTGRRLWHFQTVHHDLWDYDLTATPVLLTVRQGGRPRDIVALATKTGFVFAFDRVTGEPLWPIEERPVPPSRMPGEQAWPTQPFPTRPAPFVPQSFSLADLNPHLDPAERDSLERQIRGMLNLGIYTPPDTQATLQIPGNRGGANWGSTAGDPRDGTFYVLAYNMPSVLKLEPIVAGAVGTGGSPIDRGQTSYQANCQLCHGADRAGRPTSGIPSLAGVTDRLGHDEFIDIIRGGRGQMPGFPQLAEAEIDALRIYLANPELALTPGQANVGESTQPAGPVRYQSGWNHILDRRGVPAIRPPWFRLTAYDMNTGDIRWQVPVGDVPHLAERGIRGTGSAHWIRGGPAITAGELIFLPTPDALRAYDRDTGAELWSAPLPGVGAGIPSVYEVGGRQYVVVSAMGGGQGTPPATGPRTPSYVAFALPAR